LSKIYTFSLNKMLLYVFLCVYMTCPLYQLTFIIVYSFTFKDLIHIKSFNFLGYYDIETKFPPSFNND